MSRLQPGSPEWLTKVTASKVAAILGLSPFESPRSLWDLMKGRRPADDPSDEMLRGQFLEEGILRWFFARHPELTRIGAEQTVTRPDLPWAAATPDDISTDARGQRVPVEAKTDARGDGWGTPGTDEIPLYYLTQCIWTMHIGGWDRIHVAALGPFLELAEYEVRYDADLAKDIEARCLAFYESLMANEPPPLDGHTATYESLRAVHPDIDPDLEVQIPPAAAWELLTAKQVEADAKTRHTLAKSVVLEAMGPARRATCAGQVIAQRQPTSSGKPALYHARKPVDLDALPTPDAPEAAAA
jgi:putative phage-type endonuclease